MHLLSDVYLWGCTLTQVGRNTSVELPITAMVDHPAGIRGRVDRRNERRHISHLTSKVVTSHVASHCCTRSGLVRESSVLQQQHPLQASLQLSRLAFRDCLAPTQQHSLWQTQYNNESCTLLAVQWTNTSFHAINPVSADYNDVTCLPDNEHPCSSSGYPRYVVQATNANDVQQAVSFAAKTGIRLIVKGTGHDFLSRSASPSPR
jgi:hypothetical protein